MLGTVGSLVEFLLFVFLLKVLEDHRIDGMVNCVLSGGVCSVATFLKFAENFSVFLTFSSYSLEFRSLEKWRYFPFLLRIVMQSYLPRLSVLFRSSLHP